MLTSTLARDGGTASWNATTRPARRSIARRPREQAGVRPLQQEAIDAALEGRDALVAAQHDARAGESVAAHVDDATPDLGGRLRGACHARHS